MKVLLVSSEAEPFKKVGGLGDFIGALPKVLKKHGIDIRVVIPKYKGIQKMLGNDLVFEKAFNIKVGWRNQYCGILKYKYNNVIYYFIDNKYYFNRDSIYGYDDEGERFAFFDRAILEFLKVVDWKPDIIHCNDWETGMIPTLLKLEYKKDNFYQDIKTVFSIHNLSYQGIFNKKILPDLFGYNMNSFEDGTVEFYGKVSFMKAGINYSDYISTVSKTYAEEIKTHQYGDGLEGLIREKQYKMEGITNGIDYEEYDPFNDKNIYCKCENKILNYKSANKRGLQEELGLPIKYDLPIIAVIGSLVNQKGIDLIVNITDRLLQHNVQLVILGEGENYYEDHFISLQNRYKDKVSVNIGSDDILARKIYSAADMVLIPSLFEPCGLEQIIALRYGAIPIVRETGGLKDTISSYNKYNKEGNGFSFTDFNSNELLSTIEYALSVFKEKKVWNSIILNAMNSNNSLGKCADKYIKLYEKVIRDRV